MGVEIFIIMYPATVMSVLPDTMLLIPERTITDLPLPSVAMTGSGGSMPRII